MPNPTVLELTRQMRTDLSVLQESFRLHKADIASFELARMSIALAVLSEAVQKLEKAKDEADKRQWQFVYIFAGGMATLLVTAVVQLLIAMLKK